MRIGHRVAAGFAVLLTLFLAVVLLQLVAGDRLRAEHAEQAARAERTRDANRAVLQYMTDAETGVRGFQLTGERAFLEPYDRGRAGASAALNELAAAAGADGELARLVRAQRQAAAHWLDAYGIPIVDAGVADADSARAARGKQMFDEVRRANVAVDTAVARRQRDIAAADRRSDRLSSLIFAGLAVLVLVTGLVLALLHQRQLLVPLEHIRLTLRRLADGDLSARAVPAGPGELRAVIGCLNDLAAETERLIGAEKARTAGIELRRTVAAELQGGDPAVRRVAELIGAAFGATRVSVHPAGAVEVSWPAEPASLPADVARRARAAEPGTVLIIPELPGTAAVPLSGDDGGPPGLLCVIRPGRPEWTAVEHRLLGTLGREIDHALRDHRLRRRQAHLIGELRRLDEQKDVFVSTVTHELRTPLTSILGYTELLGDDGDELSPAQRRGLEAIRRNAHRLLRTVADLLLLDRSIERTGAEAVPVNLGALVTAVHGELAPAARAKDLQYPLETAPAWVRGDGARLERALRGLLENAIKFTPAGGRCAVRLATTGDDRAVVTISDTGIGIPAEDVPGLFSPFHRGANAMDQAVQGAGLGLAIVRTVVTEHGGTVSAQSELGRGSTFTMTLPLVPVEMPAFSAPSGTPSAG